MLFTSKLSFFTLWHNPGRLILTGLSIITAAGVVTWMVSGYDTTLTKLRQTEVNPPGIPDLMALMPIDKQQQIPENIYQKLQNNEAVSEVTQLATINVNARLRGGGRGGPGGPGGPGGGQGAQRGAGAATQENQRGEPRGPGGPGGGAEMHGGQRGGPGDGPGGGAEMRGGRRGGPGGQSLDSTAGRPSSPSGDSASVSLPPPSYGLPRMNPSVIATTAINPPRPLVSGSWLEAQPADGTPATSEATVIPCVLPESLAAMAGGLKVGDSLPVGTMAGTFILKVQGIIVNAARMPLPRQNNRQGKKTYTPPGNGIFLSWSDAEKVAGGTLSTTCLTIKLHRPEDSQKFLDSTIAALDPDGTLAWVTTDDLEQARQKSSGSNAQKMQAYSATGLSMLISFIIIFASLGMGIDERVRQLAVLRTIALTKWQLARSIFMEATFFGLLGWGGGLLTGRIMLSLLPKIAPAAARGMSDAKIGFWTVLLTGICAMFGSWLAAIYPAWRATRIHPLDAMAPLALVERSRIPRWLLLVAIPLLITNPLLVTIPGLEELTRIRLYAFIGCPAMSLGFVLLAPAFYSVCRLALQRLLAFILRLQPQFLTSQLDANLWRAAGTVTALSIGLGLYMTIQIWSVSMLKPFVPGAWMPDMFVSMLPGGITDTAMESIRNIPGIDATACLPIAIEQAALTDDLTGSQQRQSVTRQDNVVILGVSMTEGLAGDKPLFPFKFRPEKDRARALAELTSVPNSCLVPTHFAMAAKLQVGDSFSVTPPDDPENPVSMRVAGLIDLPGWHWFSKFSGVRRNAVRTAAMIFAPEDSVRQLFNLQRTNYLWFNMTAGADSKAIIKELQLIADRHVGESYHVPGGGTSQISAQHLHATVTADLHTSITSRTEGIVSGMLKMPLLILLITSFAVANTAVAALRARRREIGVMRAVGLSGLGLTRLILGEAIVITVAATIISLAFGLFAGLCSAQMSTHLSFFGGMGWNFAVPWAGLGRGLMITLGICMVAAAPVAIVAGCKQPLELLE